MGDPIYILGAGPAGMAAAYRLNQLGFSVVVVEREEKVGGLAKSIQYQGFILDYGPHRFFTKILPVRELWNQVLESEQVTVRRLTRIYYRKQYFQYPIQAWEVLRKVGWWESLHIVLSYLWAQLIPRPAPQNFADWVKGKFGTRLFQMFFEGYTEKLWGLPCTEISADWAAQRIKGLSLGQAIQKALGWNRSLAKSLIDQFQFPRLGSGQLYEKMQEYLLAEGQKVLLNTEVVTLRHRGSQVVELQLRNLQDGSETWVSPSHVISSIPLTVLVQSLRKLPPPQVLQAARNLRFRNTVLVYLIVQGSQLFPDNWLYINDPTVGVGRVTNFANWSPAMLPNQEQTPLCCEYWCNFGDPLWQAPEEELLALAEKELRQIGLLHDQKIYSGFVVRLPRTYPIYTGSYKEDLAILQEYLSQFENLQVMGRYGSFKYNNQDHSLLMGLLAAENILRPGSHNLWQVNSDDDYQEEIKVPSSPLTIQR
ncbi:NAD(P)/FAD-dependent oxidoreductase [Synechococcus sp. R6-5]|uniref:NAD(P)/FAD-dependent oxidoreductase n=1 Tax=Synechococcus sp. R6-5 TaxID=2421326 RepID=UPI0039C44D68